MFFFLLIGFPLLAVWLVWRFGLDGNKNPLPDPPEEYDPNQDIPIWWKNRK